jgi:hypothetical protein
MYYNYLFGEYVVCNNGSPGSNRLTGLFSYCTDWLGALFSPYKCMLYHRDSRILSVDVNVVIFILSILLVAVIDY